MMAEFPGKAGEEPVGRGVREQERLLEVLKLKRNLIILEEVHTASSLLAFIRARDEEHEFTSWKQATAFPIYL